MDRVLLVDDEKDLRGIVSEVLGDEGFSVVEAEDGLQAITLFRKEPPDAVLLDLQMPRMNGVDAMREFRRIAPDVPIIILTAHGDIPTAVEAMKNGVYDFMVKPPDFSRLVITLRRALETRRLSKEIERAQNALKSSLEHQLGRGEAMKAVIRQIEQVAGTQFSVIIQGETGTGKSVVAEAVHSLSGRSGKPFVSVDIGLIPDLLVESELFGYKKGAFTGAEKDKPGYFEAAQGGTIFLDELENMSPHVQAKLLSVIEKKKIYPLGGTSELDVDTRIIAATNKDIRDAVEKKEFREDLYYRLGEFIICLPPLRERADDIPFFARKFLFDASSELNKQIREISADALASLAKYTWPGNLRELKNVMRRAALHTETDVIERECVESLMGQRGRDRYMYGDISLKEAVKDLEKKMIVEALARTEGNKTKAAEMLEMSYATLFAKIKEFGIK
ncbi:MAG: sigma-54 dependent transcriptional regulator [Nitrospiraceae bacterium]|nr:sigma-54 dependent transcriptional regulator [Nitrospiraceae bacterium]